MRIDLLALAGCLTAALVLPPARGASAAEGAAGAQVSADFWNDLQTVAVKPGETLEDFAQRCLEDPARWDELLKSNALSSSERGAALGAASLRVPVRLLREDLRAAHLVYRRNKVLVRRMATADWKPTSDNLELFRDDWIRTQEESQAQVRFLDGDVLQLGANSMAAIRPVNSDYAVALKRGGTFVGRGKVVTASAKIAPQSADTKYTATVQDDLSTVVKVYKGAASVESHGQAVDVKAGMTTEVKLGLAPSAPTAIKDLAAFEAGMARLESDLRSTKSRVVIAEAPAPSVKAARAPAASVPRDVKSLKEQAAGLQVGQAVSGYRVQCAGDEGLSKLLADKVLDVDTSITAAALGLPSGRYWCRIAAMDLLGAQGQFSKPREVALSAR